MSGENSEPMVTAAVGKVLRAAPCPVATDLVWKDRVSKEEKAMKRAMEAWNRATPSYEQLEAELEEIKKARQKLGVSHYLPAIDKLLSRQENWASAEMDVTSVPFPKTSSACIGWLSTSPEILRGFQRKDDFHPRYCIFKRLGWPDRRNFW